VNSDPPSRLAPALEDPGLAPDGIEGGMEPESPVSNASTSLSEDLLAAWSESWVGVQRVGSQFAVFFKGHLVGLFQSPVTVSSDLE
jgi:hypothetical protein